MSVDEALAQYSTFGNDVFGNARVWHERSLCWWPRAKFASTQTKGAFSRIIHAKISQTRSGYDPIRAREEQFVSREDRTRTYVVID
jgi:hypothetical protein